MNVKVIDRIMGSGKTTNMINYINEKSKSDNDFRFLFVTPYLTEVKRIVDNTFATECSSNKKSTELIELMKNGKSVVITHELFKRLKYKDLEKIKYNYTLVIDEQITLFELMNDYSSSDFKILESAKIITSKEGKLIVSDSNFLKEKSMYQNLLKSIDIGTIFTENNQFYKIFDINILNFFDNIYILTYLFENQLLHAYFKYFNINVEIEKDSKEEERNIKKELKNLINIYEDVIGTKNNLNSNYFIDKTRNLEKRTALSSSWFDKADNKNIKQLKNNLKNYLLKRNKCFKSENSSPNENIKFENTILWTTKKEFKKLLESNGNKKGFISLNIKATNEYKDTYNLAYIYNRFLNPLEKGFFTSNDIKVDEDIFALSELIQWIWRSRIRDNKPINIYIPSQRMRNLLIDWLDNKI